MTLWRSAPNDAKTYARPAATTQAGKIKPDFDVTLALVAPRENLSTKGTDFGQVNTSGTRVEPECTLQYSKTVSSGEYYVVKPRTSLGGINNCCETSNILLWKQ